MNPLLVQDMLGHSTLEMTRRYTHLGIEAKRKAMVKLDQEHVELSSIEGEAGGKEETRD
jgi:hypothetical protein